MLEFFSLAQPQFYLYFLYFLLAFTASFLIPGINILNFKKNKFNNLEKLAISIPLGIVIFSLLSYIFYYFNLRFLLIIYILVNLYIFYKNKTWQKIRKDKSFKIFNKLSYFLIIIGSLLQMSSVFGSGIRYQDGIKFYWLNGADGIFHLSLISSIIDKFPPMQPGSFDLSVTNYHYLSNLLFASFCSLWRLPISHTFFQYMPLLLAPLFGLLIAALLNNWQKNNQKVVNWGIFLLYFSADSSWLADFIINRQLTWQTATIDSGIIQFLNMPQAMAKLAFLAGLLLFTLYRKEKNNYFGLLSTVFFISLVSYKVYFGIFIAISVSILLAFKFFQLKIKKFFKQEKLFIIFFILLALGSAALFLPTNKGAGGLFWAPFDWPKLFITQLHWNDWMLRMQVYQAYYNYRAILFFELLATVIFLISIFGLRLIGFLSVFKKIRKNINQDAFVLLYPSVLLMTFLGLNTLQTSGDHNVFNFFVVALTSLTLLSAIVLGNLKLNKLLIILIVSFVMPRTIYTATAYAKNYYHSFDRVLISNQKLAAYDFLKKNYNNQIIQGYYNNFLVKETPQFWMFTGQRSYLDGIGILKSHNQNIQNKELTIKTIFTPKQATASAQALLDSNINLVFLDKKENEKMWLFSPVYNKKTATWSLDPILAKSKIVFENDEIEIYEVDRNSLQEFLQQEKNKQTINSSSNS